MTPAQELTDRLLETAADWLVRLNDQNATQHDFATWQAWLAADTRHAQAFNEIQDTWRRSASVPRMSGSTFEALHEMREGLDDELAAARRRRVAVRWGVLAASLASVVTSFALWRSYSTVIATDTAELRSVRLPDGSRAALGPETRVRIDFSDESRTLQMTTGEAYFEVRQAPDRPFVVGTPGGRVVAIGTAFSIHATNGRVAVAVTQGAVRVESSADKETRVVSAGERFVRDNGNTRTEPLKAASNPLAWQQGRLEYESEPFRVVVADINRYTPQKLRLTDPALGELRYTGTVFPDALEAWLASIQGVFPVRVAVRGGERVILREDSSSLEN